MSEQDTIPAAKAEDVLPEKKEKITKTLKYEFTTDEMLQLGKDLGGHAIKKSQVESDKKKVVADFKAQTDELDAKIQRCSNSLQSGFTFRDFECTVTFHSPKIGMKTIHRDDTMELVKEEKMTQQECQEQLGLQEDILEEQKDEGFLNEPEQEQGSDTENDDPKTEAEVEKEESDEPEVA